MKRLALSLLKKAAILAGLSAIFGAIALLFALNLGRILDVSEPPEKADIIVALGGGRVNERVGKALKLWKSGYSKSGQLMINGYSYVKYGSKPPKIVFNTPAKRYLQRHGFPMEKLVFMVNAPNTMGEVRFVKRYLLDHKMRSVMIVSSPPHTRRIRMLARLAGYEKAGLHLNVVGTSPRWWDRNRWWHNRYARAAVLNEVFKIPFNYIKYSVLEPLGILETCHETCESSIRKLKQTYRYFIKKAAHFHF